MQKEQQSYLFIFYLPETFCDDRSWICRNIFLKVLEDIIFSQNTVLCMMFIYTCIYFEEPLLSDA